MPSETKSASQDWQFLALGTNLEMILHRQLSRSVDFNYWPSELTQSCNNKKTVCHNKESILLGTREAGYAMSRLIKSGLKES